MKPSIPAVLVLTVALFDARSPATAADHLILGKRMVVVQRSPSENVRRVVMTGMEHDTDIGPSIVGDPRVSGATLTIVVNGATPTVQSFDLAAERWHGIEDVGFFYSGPVRNGVPGPPVRRVRIRRSSRGLGLIIVTVRGNVGADPLNVVPPNPGDDGGLILDINGGDRYCVMFGGAAGGNEAVDDDELWRIVSATAQPGCPTPAGSPSGAFIDGAPQG